MKGRNHNRTAGPVVGIGVNRIPASQMAMRAPKLDHFEDPKQVISDRRIRRAGDVFGLDEQAVSMCTMIRAEDGGPLRTFNGGLWHENGWHSSVKAGRLLHFEGETALWKLLESDTDHNVAKLGAESVGFEFPLKGKLVRYTCDIEQTDAVGRITLLEIKRTDRDLEDPGYRLKLAYVMEVCRRCGIRFLVVFRDEIFKSLVHRRNACLFASRGFVPIGRQHRGVLINQRRTSGGKVAYGALAGMLAPGHPVACKAVVQAMLVHRLVRMDLTLRVHDGSPVTIV
jgi:hypothetical protein